MADTPWTHEELDRWFREDFLSSPGQTVNGELAKRFDSLTVTDRDRLRFGDWSSVPTEVRQHLVDFFEVWQNLGPAPDEAAESIAEDVAVGVGLPVSGQDDRGFLSLGLEAKTALRQAIEAWAAHQAAAPEEAESAIAELSEIVVPPGAIPVAPDEADPDAGAPMDDDRRSMWLLVAGVIGVVGVVLAMLLSGGDGDVPADGTDEVAQTEDDPATDTDGSADAGTDGGADAGDADQDAEDSGDEDTSDDVGTLHDADGYAQEVIDACDYGAEFMTDLLTQLRQPGASEVYELAYDVLDDLSRGLTRSTDEATEETQFALRGATRDMRGAVDDLGDAAAASDDAAYAEAYAEFEAAAEEFRAATPPAATESCRRLIGG